MQQLKFLIKYNIYCVLKHNYSNFGEKKNHNKKYVKMKLILLNGLQKCYQGHTFMMLNIRILAFSGKSWGMKHILVIRTCGGVVTFLCNTMCSNLGVAMKQCNQDNGQINVARQQVQYFLQQKVFNQKCTCQMDANQFA